MAAQPTYTTAAIRAIRAAVDAEQDFGGWLSGVLAGAAADLGSSYALIARRPDSWEAQRVAELVAGAVGWNDEYLDRYRR